MLRMHVLALLLVASAAVGMSLDETPELLVREAAPQMMHFLLKELAASDTVRDPISSVVCQSSEATAFLGFKCDASTSTTTATSTTPYTTTAKPSSTSVTSSTVSTTATYAMHALAIGDWGIDMALDACCNRYRQTGTGNEEYYKDQQAQSNIAYLLSLSAAKLSPKLVIGHGYVCVSIGSLEYDGLDVSVLDRDNFYWDGLGSEDVSYRFTNTFEAKYMYASLLSLKWINVMGNHDYGGAAFICGTADNAFVECASEADLLKQLDDKFTRQSSYTSPYDDRWQMPARYYVESLSESGVTVDIFNVDTNAAAVHGGQQICCQCYGYKAKYGGTANCNDVARGDDLCAGGDTDLYDACLAQLQTWQDDSLAQLKRDCQESTATWKIVNSHYSPAYHMTPTVMAEWHDAVKTCGIQLFLNGHTHAEGHDYGTFKTHFITNGAGGGIQSESMGSPPATATNVSQIWAGENAPYGFFELSFAATQLRLRFVTFDSAWVFASSASATVKGGADLQHCWLIPLDGSTGTSCA